MLVRSVEEVLGTSKTIEYCDACNKIRYCSDQMVKTVLGTVVENRDKKKDGEEKDGTRFNLI